MQKRWWMAGVSFLLFSGCSAQSSSEKSHMAEESHRLPVEKVVKHKGMQKASEAIVVFERGMSVSEAKKVVASYGMTVLKVYQTLSERTQKPMMHIASPLLPEVMLKRLKADPHIVSVSINAQNELYSK
jgi:predicted amidohydrolase